MIEEYLVNYGVLGIWTMTLLIQVYKTDRKTSQVIENNTIALTQVRDNMIKCKRRKK